MTSDKYCIQFKHLTNDHIQVSAVRYVDSLQTMYKLCDCTVIDIINLGNHIPEYQHFFEGIVLDNESIDIVLDDNGKYFRKPATLPLFHSHRVYDILVGDFIVIVGNNDTGETYGFEYEQVEKIMSALELYTMTFKSPLHYSFGKLYRVEVPTGYKSI